MAGDTIGEGQQHGELSTLIQQTNQTCSDAMRGFGTVCDMKARHVTLEPSILNHCQ